MVVLIDTHTHTYTYTYNAKKINIKIEKAVIWDAKSESRYDLPGLNKSRSDASIVMIHQSQNIMRVVVTGGINNDTKKKQNKKPINACEQIKVSLGIYAVSLYVCVCLCFVFFLF